MKNHGKQEKDMTVGADGVKRRRLNPDGPQWRRLADQLARDYAPEMYPCAHCSYPVAKGYCCGTCGTADPEGYLIREEAKKRLGVEP